MAADIKRANLSLKVSVYSRTFYIKLFRRAFLLRRAMRLSLGAGNLVQKSQVHQNQKHTA